MVFGYARVSTEAQELSRQIDMLNAYGVDKVYQEKITGTKIDRPQLERLKEVLREGDVVVIESLSRLGRSTKDLLTIIEEWESKGIKVVSLKEKIDTNSPTGKLLLTVLSAICQFERDIIAQRTQEGLVSARARGRSGGRPKVDAKKIEKALKLYDAKTHSAKEIAEICGISVPTLYRELKKRNE